MNENELYHFGVKGMKWGVRRNRSSFVSTSGPKRLPGTYASDGNGWTAKAKRLPGAIVKKDGYDKSRTPLGVASLTSKTSGKSKQKAAANTPEAKAALKRSVKEYGKQMDKANSLTEKANSEWATAQEMYKKTGKNAVSRVLNNIKGKSAEVKAYKRQYDKASGLSDRAYDEEMKAREMYKKTGKTRISRVYNNAKYGGFN